MSGVLFTSAGLRESWRLSADFDPLSISNSQRWPSGPNDRVASSRRVSSPPRLTALPHLTSPSKAEISRTAYKRHAQSFGTLDELKEDDSSTYGSSSKYQEDRPTSSSFGSVKGALRAIYGKHDTEFESSDAPDEQSIQYPTGFRWFLILLSGALPYVVVSGPSPLKRYSLYHFADSEYRLFWMIQSSVCLPDSNPEGKTI